MARAAEPAGWTSRQDHHDRLLCLLGHPVGSAPPGLEIARTSLALLAAADPAATAEAATELRAFCIERVAELRRERSVFWDPPVIRRRAIDLACAPTSKEAQLLHRYEVAHETSLRAAIRGLLTLEKSGADLPDEPEAQSAAGPGVAAEAVAAPGGTEAPDKQGTNLCQSESCVKLASVGGAGPAGTRPGRPAGSPGRPGRPAGADPGPRKAPKRR